LSAKVKLKLSAQIKKYIKGKASEEVVRRIQSSFNRRQFVNEILKFCEFFDGKLAENDMAWGWVGWPANRSLDFAGMAQQESTKFVRAYFAQSPNTRIQIKGFSHDKNKKIRVLVNTDGLEEFLRDNCKFTAIRSTKPGFSDTITLPWYRMLITASTFPLSGAYQFAWVAGNGRSYNGLMVDVNRVRYDKHYANFLKELDTQYSTYMSPEDVEQELDLLPTVTQTFARALLAYRDTQGWLRLAKGSGITASPSYSEVPSNLSEFL